MTLALSAYSHTADTPHLSWWGAVTAEFNNIPIVHPTQRYTGPQAYEYTAPLTSCLLALCKQNTFLGTR